MIPRPAGGSVHHLARPGLHLLHGSPATNHRYRCTSCEARSMTYETRRRDMHAAVDLRMAHAFTRLARRRDRPSAVYRAATHSRDTGEHVASEGVCALLRHRLDGIGRRSLICGQTGLTGTTHRNG